MSRHTLEIAKTWDGFPLWGNDRAEIVLTTTFDSLVLSMDAPFYNNPAPEGPVGLTDGLWEHEVIEFFLSGPEPEDGKIPYLEMEFSPHGHFLVIQLCGVRVRHQLVSELQFSAVIEGDRWRGEAVISREHLPPGPHRCSAYGIHSVGDVRRYAAMKEVPGDKPDFHRVEYFVPITLEFEADDES